MNLKLYCPNITCVNHSNSTKKSFYKDGYYKTKHNDRYKQKYQCRACGKCFSGSTIAPKTKFKKPELTALIFRAYCLRMTVRGIATQLGCSTKTVQTRIDWLGKRCREYHNEVLRLGLLKSYRFNFDEMETFQHTRLKPISVSIAVDATNGNIIEALACQMSGKGHTAALSKKIYGFRRDDRPKTRVEALASVSHCVLPKSVIITDGMLSYILAIRTELPTVKHKIIKSRANNQTQTVGGLDEMFWLNLTCAKIRHNLSRFTRRSWITTKRIQMLQAHLDMYICFNNKYPIEDIINGNLPTKPKVGKLGLTEEEIQDLLSQVEEAKKAA